MQKNRGLTLIELLIGLMIASILAFLSLGMGFHFINKNHIQIVENDISSAVRYARNSALLYNKAVVLAPEPDSDDWSKGMILFIDNKHHRYSKNDTLLHQWQWFFADVHVQWHGFRSKHFLVFTPEFKHASVSGHFSLTTSSNLQTNLVINRFGRIGSKA